MGRKSTPQPLMLPGSNNTSHHNVDNANRDNSSLVPGESLPHAQGLPSADSKSVSSQRSFTFANGFNSAATPTAPGRPPLPPTDHSDWQRRPHPDSARDSAAQAHRPATSALEAASSSGARPQPVARQQTEGRKPSKSGFFHFSKGSRVGSQPLPQVQSVPDTRQQTGARAGDQIAADNYRGMTASSSILFYTNTLHLANAPFYHANMNSSCRASIR